MSIEDLVGDFPVQTSHDGLHWVAREGSDDFLAFSRHEIHLWHIVSSLCPEGGTFLDVGAHVGYYTVRLAALKGAHCLAVEPEPDTLVALAANCYLNEIEERVQILPYAASDEVMTVSLVNPHENFSNGSTRVAPRVPGAVEVQAYPLDEIGPIQALTSLDLVKIDVEGHDAHALRGMRETVNRLRPIIFLECHDKLYPGQGIERAVHRVLKEEGYEWYRVAGNVHVDYLVCKPAEWDEAEDPALAHLKG